MIRLVVLLQACFAHRLMLTWNCGNTIYQGGFTENIPCQTQHVFIANIKMTDLQKLGKVKRSSVVPQVNFLSIMEEGENIDELDELDAKISDLLAKGEKVVLLGRHFNAQNETPRQK